MGNARAYHAANQNASNQDSLREYEPLDMRISVSENNIMDEISTAHLRIGVRNRCVFVPEILLFVLMDFPFSKQGYASNVFSGLCFFQLLLWSQMLEM